MYVFAHRNIVNYNTYRYITIYLPKFMLCCNLCQCNFRNNDCNLLQNVLVFFLHFFLHLIFFAMFIAYFIVWGFRIRRSFKSVCVLLRAVVFQQKMSCVGSCKVCICVRTGFVAALSIWHNPPDAG